MQNRDGFTLIELMVVTIVLGLLASMAMASFSGVREKTMVTAARAEVRSAITSAERYRAVYGRLPATLDDMVTAGFHTPPDNIDYCEFTRVGGPPDDIVIEAAHRGSTIHLTARYPAQGVTMQEVTAATDCS